MWKLGIENPETLAKCHKNPLKKNGKNLKPYWKKSKQNKL
jgi:hypothetical protein